MTGTKGVAIFIGGFNLANYKDFLNIGKANEIFFLHAAASWYIKDDNIKKYLIRPGDFIEQRQLEGVDDDSIKFSKELTKATKGITFEGVNFIEVLRFKIARKYATIIEAYLMLKETIKRYKPSMVILEPPKGNMRCQTYNEVAEYLLNRLNISFRYNCQNDDKNLSAPLDRLKKVRYYFKEHIRSLISFGINLSGPRQDKKDIILFYGAFKQFEDTIQWFADAKDYKLTYLKEGVPFNKISFFLKNRVCWHKIPEFDTGQTVSNNEYIENLCSRLFENPYIVKTYFDNENILAEAMRSYIKKELYRGWGIYERLVKICSSIFSDSRIKAVFVDEDQLPIARIVVDSANLAGKQTFLLCHGILSEKTNFVFSVKNIYTYGKKISERIREHSDGICPNIIEVGMPRLSRLALIDALSARDKICKDLSIQPDKKIILFVMGKMSFDGNFYANNLKKNRQMAYLETLRRLKDLTAGDSRIHVIVKLHPHTSETLENSYYKRDYFNAEGFSVIDLYDIDLLVKGCDMVMHCMSTVAYHGFIAQKPVVRVRSEFENTLWDFVGSGAEEVVDIGSGSFDKTVTEILFDTKKQETLCKKANEYLKQDYSQDLNIEERVLRSTYEILKKAP